MAPAVMVAATAAPSIMVAPATAAHMMPVAVPMSALDLNHRFILRGKRRDPQPGGSGCGHRQQQRATNQCNASHASSSHRMIAILPIISRSCVCSARAEMPIFTGPIVQSLPIVPEHRATSPPETHRGIRLPHSVRHVRPSGPFAFGALAQVLAQSPVSRPEPVSPARRLLAEIGRQGSP
jgi:hypothetical protein